MLTAFNAVNDSCRVCIAVAPCIWQKAGHAMCIASSDVEINEATLKGFLSTKGSDWSDMCSALHEMNRIGTAERRNRASAANRSPRMSGIAKSTIIRSI